MMWVFIIFILLTYVYLKIKQKQKYWEERGVKFIKPMFFFGNIMTTESKSFAETIIELSSMFPDESFFGLYSFLDPIFVAKDPELLKQMTVKHFDHFTDHRTLVDGDVDPFWAKNLVNADGDRWRRLRSILSPSFTSSKMKVMYSLIDECAKQFVLHFRKQDELVEVEMKDILSRYTNDVVATVAFGLQCDSVKDKDNRFYVMGGKISTFRGSKMYRFAAHAVFPKLAKLFKVKIIPSDEAEYFSRIIEDTVRTRRRLNILRPDMIQLLLEAQSQNEDITMDDIVAQASIFFMAGFETVSTMLSFTLYELALNPHVQKKLREEINTVCEQLNYETLFSLKYLDMVVSEGLRKWPPALLTDRQVTKTFTIETEGKPVVLQEGLTCWVFIHAIHRDPRNYPEPDRFDPERFNEENRAKIKPFTYLPFGAGPRNCIGSRFALLEVKLLLVRLLKELEVVPIARTQIPLLLETKVFTLNSRDGIWLGFKKVG